MSREVPLRAEFEWLMYRLCRRVAGHWWTPFRLDPLLGRCRVCRLCRVTELEPKR